MVKVRLVTTSQSQATALFRKVVVVEVVQKGADTQGLEKEVQAGMIFCVSSEAMSHVSVKQTQPSISRLISYICNHHHVLIIGKKI